MRECEAHLHAVQRLQIAIDDADDDDDDEATAGGWQLLCAILCSEAKRLHNLIIPTDDSIRSNGAPSAVKGHRACAQKSGQTPDKTSHIWSDGPAT